jgi:hypothetical protein
VSVQETVRCLRQARRLRLDENRDEVSVKAETVGLGIPPDPAVPQALAPGVFPVEIAFDLRTKWLVCRQASLVDPHRDGPRLFSTPSFVGVVSLVEPREDVLSTLFLPPPSVLASSEQMLAVPASRDADDLHQTERGLAEVAGVARLLAPSPRARRTQANHFRESSTFAHPLRGSGSAA